MKEKVLSVVIVGLGNRGIGAYGRYCLRHPEQFRIVGLMDIDPVKVAQYAREFDVPSQNCFTDEDSLFAAGRLADVMFVCSQDRDHVRQATAAARLGYHLLIEKPVSPEEDECRKLLRVTRERGTLTCVCHVLRYTYFFRTIKEWVDHGEIGEILSYHQLENVGYWHLAHSFVRGNWRNDKLSPMILQKCCHDLDLICWIVGRQPLCLSSFGHLTHFRADKAPEGATAYCLDGCKVKEKCPYDAETYIRHFRQLPEGDRDRWPFYNVALNPTEERLYDALRRGPYGRCVYHCDNNVVDHQTVNIDFEGGICANLLMIGPTDVDGRTVKITGSTGEIIGNDVDFLELRRYGGEHRRINIADIIAGTDGHNGGDSIMLNDFYHTVISQTGDTATSLEGSIVSHLCAFAAERSRRNGGAVQQIRMD